MRNNISLLSILGTFLLIVSFFLMIMVLTILGESSINDQVEQLMLLLFSCSAIGMFFCSIGMFLKKKWSRIVALILLGLATIGWTLIAYIMMKSIGFSFRRIEQFSMLIGMNFFVYTFLISTFIFLNNAIVKKEFRND